MLTECNLRLLLCRKMVAMQSAPTPPLIAPIMKKSKEHMTAAMTVVMIQYWSEELVAVSRVPARSIWLMESYAVVSLMFL